MTKFANISISKFAYFINMNEKRFLEIVNNIFSLTETTVLVYVLSGSDRKDANFVIVALEIKGNLIIIVY